MRIAYVTTYQGPTLLERRPIVRNRSLSNTVKIELIASLLRASGHEVEVLSQGEVVDNKLKFYPGFSEPQPFDSKVPVHYSSAFPVRRVNGFWSSFQTLRLLKARHRASSFDLVIIFNLKDPQVACAKYALKQTSKWVRALVKDIQYRLDVNTLHRDDSATTLTLNEIGRVTLRTTQPLFYDEYRRNRTTGSFILVEEHSNDTVAGGMIVGTS